MNEDVDRDVNEQPESPCPLCGTPLRSRRRDPLVRAFGALVLYGSCFTFLLLLPGITLPALLTTVIFGVWGMLLMKGETGQWCPGCWFDTRQRN